MGHRFVVGPDPTGVGNGDIVADVLVVGCSFDDGMPEIGEATPGSSGDGS